MRKKLAFLMIFTIVLAASVGSAADADELIEDRISITINGSTDAYIETLGGERYGYSPFTHETYSEITGVLRTSGDGKTMIEMPADQLYGIWLERPEDNYSESFSTEIRTADWWAGFGIFQNNSNNFDLLISPRSMFSENGPVFNKISLNANANSLPEIHLEFNEVMGTCRMSLDPEFDMGTADPKSADTPAELVLTYYSEDGLLSLWAVSSSVETEDLFTGSNFLFRISLACESEGQTVREKGFPQITMIANGIFFIDLGDFRSGGESYFEGDLDGDDVYEVEPSGFQELSGVI